ncbi:MAG: hypothetical protein O2985_18005 [Proteobacteria bacterium]|nr:hypothetical protein [Pseudomonadota bacterium]
MTFRGLPLLALCLVAPLMLIGCSEEEEQAKGPKKDFIIVRNDSSTEASVRLKMWKSEAKPITAGKEERIEFVSNSKTVQVEAKSRKKWDDCWVTMQVGQTLVVFNGQEQIACKVE